MSAVSRPFQSSTKSLFATVFLAVTTFFVAACGPAPSPTTIPDLPAGLSAARDTVDSRSRTALETVEGAPASPDSLKTDIPLPETWEQLFRDAMHHMAADELSQADDLLLLLQDAASRPPSSGSEPSFDDHRRSIRRRSVLLGGLLAEQRACRSTAAEFDSVLAREYLGLHSAGFPDTLTPATGTELPPFQADLLKVQHARVDRWLDYFTGRGRRHFQLWLDRKAAVESLVTSILAAEELPAELIYLAMIESGLSTRARSSVGAVGPWQFMPATARRHGLTVNWWVDERRDLVDSTHAAASYLRSLYEEFGDWALVLAAYNSGEGRVRRQLRDRGHDNFWDYSLPRQTVEYVPKFIAAAQIGRDPESYGFTSPSPSSLVYDTLLVDDATDLGVIAECSGATEDELAAANPALLRRATPPGIRDFPVRLPAGTADMARSALRKVPESKRLTWRKHGVSRGETLSHIAARWGTTARDIQRSNGMGQSTLIRPGDQLLIPMPRELADLARTRAEKAGRYVPPQGYEKVTYSVRNGDTLGGIAHRLGVTVKHLQRVNGIRNPHRLKVGQTLAAYRSPRRS